MRAYKFKLYQHKRNRFLHHSIDAASNIYNHCIALHKRYYRLFGKYLKANKLMKHIAKLRRRKSYWQLVGSQAVQDVVQRIDRAYQLFFKYKDRGVRPPNFKKRKKYRSFTLKQAGYKFFGGNRIQVESKVYQYWNSREIVGRVKTLTIKRTAKRTALGELFMLVVADAVSQPVIKSETGKIAGFDFGLKTFLTCSEGFSTQAPLFFKQALDDIRKASKQHSRKVKGSSNRERARIHLARHHEAICSSSQGLVLEAGTSVN